MVTRTNYFTVELGGELLGTFDDQELTLNDAFTCEQETGLTLNALLSGLNDSRAQSMRWIVWFMKWKNGAQIRLEQVPDFKLSELKVRLVPDPTPARGPKSVKASTGPDGTKI